MRETYRSWKSKGEDQGHATEGESERKEEKRGEVFVSRRNPIVKCHLPPLALSLSLSDSSGTHVQQERRDEGRGREEAGDKIRNPCSSIMYMFQLNQRLGMQDSTAHTHTGAAVHSLSTTHLINRKIKRISTSDSGHQQLWQRKETRGERPPAFLVSCFTTDPH